MTHFCAFLGGKVRFKSPFLAQNNPISELILDKGGVLLIILVYKYPSDSLGRSHERDHQLL